MHFDLKPNKNLKKCFPLPSCTFLPMNNKVNLAAEGSQKKLIILPSRLYLKNYLLMFIRLKLLTCIFIPVIIIILSTLPSDQIKSNFLLLNCLNQPCMRQIYQLTLLPILFSSNVVNAESQFFSFFL